MTEQSLCLVPREKLEELQGRLDALVQTVEGEALAYALADLCGDVAGLIAYGEARWRLHGHRSFVRDIPREKLRALIEAGGEELAGQWPDGRRHG